MATPQPPAGARLIDWISGLAVHLAADTAASERLQAVVGARRARIRVDGDTAVVALVDGEVIALSGDSPVEGTGATTRAVVLALLDGRLDATEALQAGYVTAHAHIDDLTAMLHAIEILLDAATRNPALRALATAFRAAGPGGEIPGTAGREHDALSAEVALLRRLGLCDSAPSAWPTSASDRDDGGERGVPG